jgi:hypothetical protein
MTIQPVPRQRRHTLYFLREIRAFSPVHLDTEVDMTQVMAHRGAAALDARRYSVVTYVLHAAARVLDRHPQANSAIRGTVWPKVIQHSSVNGKLTLDKTIGGQRVVVAPVLRDLQKASLDDIQRLVDRFRDGDPERMPELAGVRALHRKRWPFAPRAFRKVARPLPKRAAVFGTFAVTSLGHRPVDGFHSVGGTTVTLGLGRVLDRAVVRGGAVAVAPVMRLSLTFDHRVIDGAEAADLLGELKDDLERLALVPASNGHAGAAACADPTAATAGAPGDERGHAAAGAPRTGRPEDRA